MSAKFKAKVDELYQATKDLMSFEEMEPYCQEFNAWVREQGLKPSTLGTVLSQAGLYKKFRGLKLVAEENAVVVDKHDGNGNVVGNELKHYVPYTCGLNAKEWNERNDNTRIIDRVSKTTVDKLGNESHGTPVDPDKYLEVTMKLLASDHHNELAAGLIAATGRRLTEVIHTAIFTPIDKREYHVMFEGQLKKRGENPIFEIPTLVPAKLVIRALGRLRRMDVIKELRKEAARQHPEDTNAQHRVIKQSRNTRVNEQIKKYFGGVEGEKIIEVRGDVVEDEDGAKSSSIRAAYAALAVERDIKGAVGAKTFYYAQILGHLQIETVSREDLIRIATTLGYSDFYPTNTVPYPPMPETKPKSIRVSYEDYERIEELKDEWGKPNQQSVVEKLVDMADKYYEMEKQLQEAQMKIAELQTKEEPMTMNYEIKEMIRAEVQKAIREIGITTTVAKPEIESIEPTSTTTSNIKIEEQDWSVVDNETLKKSQGRGAVEEKIKRSFEALTHYNNYIATDNDTRWAIGNQTLRQLSGCNGLKVGEWMKQHEIVINDHNEKYNLGTYHNKRHKGVDVNSIVSWKLVHE